MKMFYIFKITSQCMEKYIFEKVVGSLKHKSQDDNNTCNIGICIYENSLFRKLCCDASVKMLFQHQ